MKFSNFRQYYLKMLLSIKRYFTDHLKRNIFILFGMIVLLVELFSPLAPIERLTGFWVAHMPDFELSAIIGAKEAKRFRNLNNVMTQYIQKKTIYDTNGKIIAKADHPDNVPPFLQKYLIDLENSRFHDTYVVDWPSVFRAAFTDIIKGRFAEGASGIIQQFSRGIILRNDKKFWLRKVKETLIGYGLADKYSHQKILQYYMNSVFLGSYNKPAVQIRGFKRGARELFGKDITHISKPEGLALITLISSPNTYLKNRSAFKAKYERLARSLIKRKLITGKEYHHLLQNLPAINSNKIKSRASKIEYQNEIIEQLKPFINDTSAIHTTIDLNVESVAHKTLTTIIQNFKKQTGIKDLDGFIIVAHNDSILSAIGSAQMGDKYMNNINIRSAWRPGSLVKPFIYSEYIREGGNIYRKLPAAGPKTFNVSGGIWTVKNYSSQDNFPRKQKAINALARSNNVAAAYLAVNYGDSLRDLLHKAGADSTFSPYPATFIGADAPRPIDLFRLLQTYTPPYGQIPNHFIFSKKDTSGYTRLFKPVIARETAYCLTNALKDPKGTLHFTESRYHWSNSNFLGKTGTAQKSTSAGLFIARPGGISVLVGVFSRSGKSLKYKTGGAIQGASLAPYLQDLFQAPSIRKRIKGEFHFGSDKFYAKKNYYVHKLKDIFKKLTSIF